MNKQQMKKKKNEMKTTQKTRSVKREGRKGSSLQNWRRGKERDKNKLKQKEKMKKNGLKR